MCRDFNGYHSGGSSFIYVNDFWLLQNLFVYLKKKKKVKSIRYSLSFPETGSDLPIGSDRELGPDKSWYQSLGLGVSGKDYVRRF